MEDFPTELPEPGVTIGPFARHGTDYTFHGVSDTEWTITGPAGITTQVRKAEDGTFEMTRTDGKTSNEGFGDSWEEIAAGYF